MGRFGPVKITGGRVGLLNVIEDGPVHIINFGGRMGPIDNH
jgi:hypothetical protein